MRLICFHSEKYARLANILRRSAELHCPDWTIDIRQVSDDWSARNRPKLRLWNEAVSTAPDDECLMIAEADLVITGSLDRILDFLDEYDFLVTTKDWSVCGDRLVRRVGAPIATGVSWLRINDRTRELFSRWHAGRGEGEREALTELLTGDHGCRVGALPQNEFNRHYRHQMNLNRKRRRQLRQQPYGHPWRRARILHIMGALRMAVRQPPGTLRPVQPDWDEIREYWLAMESGDALPDVGPYWDAEAVPW